MSIIHIDPWNRINETSKLDQLSPSVDVISNHLPYIKDHKKITDAVLNGMSNIEHYQKFAIEIIAESVFNYPHPTVTEKTVRCFSAKRPFIMLGAAGTLQYLKSKGFKTFDKIIDEQYDLESDYETRFHLVVDAIEKFVTRPISEIKKDVLSVVDILEYNYEHLQNLIDIEISEIIL